MKKSKLKTGDRLVYYKLDTFDEEETRPYKAPCLKLGQMVTFEEYQTSDLLCLKEDLEWAYTASCFKPALPDIYEEET